MEICFTRLFYKFITVNYCQFYSKLFMVGGGGSTLNSSKHHWRTLEQCGGNSPVKWEIATKTLEYAQANILFNQQLLTSPGSHSYLTTCTLPQSATRVETEYWSIYGYIHQLFISYVVILIHLAKNMESSILLDDRVHWLSLS